MAPNPEDCTSSRVSIVGFDAFSIFYLPEKGEIVSMLKADEENSCSSSSPSHSTYEAKNYLRTSFGQREAPGETGVERRARR